MSKDRGINGNPKQQAASPEQQAAMEQQQRAANAFNGAWGHLAAAPQIIVKTIDGGQHMGKLGVMVDGWLVLQMMGGAPNFIRMEHVVSMTSSSIVPPVN